MSASSKKTSLYGAFLTSVISNSPLMNDDNSSVMRCSASLNERASTTYCSVTFFCVPSS